MKLLASLIVLASLVGCSPDNGVPPSNMNLQVSGRVRVTLLNQFKDEVAYNDVRGIYLIEDTETGQTFIGISGIGISEVGSHSAGKNHRVSDER